MNKRINTINFKGEEIISFDFSKLASTDFINLLDEAYDVIRKKSDALVLFDVTNAAVFGDTLKKAKDFANNIKPFRKKSALIGILGPKKILLDSILRFSGSSRQVKAFSDENSANDWLISD